MATVTRSAQPGSVPYYQWEPADKPLSVYLSPEAANHILTEAIRGLGLVPRRGMEVGGILLGTAETGDKLLIRVEAVAPVESEHAFGPSYVLSASDKQALAGALGQAAADRGRQVVGFYRSHTRDGLALSAEDLALLAAYFPKPFHVALLVKPHVMRASVGGFFFREEGEIRSGSSYLEFALERRKTPAREEPVAERPATAPLEPAAEPLPPSDVPLPSFLQTPAKQPGRVHAWWRRRKERRAAKPQRAGRSQPLWSSWWVQVPLAVLLLATDGVLGFVVAQRYPIRLAAGHAAGDPYSLHLLVVEYGNNLHLTWDRNAPAVAQARRALLTIVDGEQNRTLDLAPVQLSSGSVIYRRLTTQVRFRLEVFVRDRQSVAETWDLKAGSGPGQGAAAELLQGAGEPAPR